MNSLTDRCLRQLEVPIVKKVLSKAEPVVIVQEVIVRELVGRGNNHDGDPENRTLCDTKASNWRMAGLASEQKSSPRAALLLFA